MLLYRKDLEDINHEPPIPVNAGWQKIDRKARALINLFLDYSQIVRVKNLTIARDT